MSDSNTPFKHKINTDALDTLGSIIDETAARDAIHVAVEPVRAGQLLRPGQHVGWLEPGVVGVSMDKIGIVDPFLQQPVQKDEICWLLVYPRQITSLRHVWSHPKFDNKE